MKTTIIFILVALSLFGCATIPQGTTPAASPLISEDGKQKSYEVLGKAEGSAGHFTLFGFIPFGRTNIDAAVQEAVAHQQGDNLINVHYYVNSAWYFIGSSTSITVKGDVIKYTLSGAGSTPLSSIRKVLPTIGTGLSHRIAIGSAVDGFAVDYTLGKSLGDYLLFSFSLGYKRYEKTETITQSYFGDTYSFESKTEYNALPIAINFGGSAKNALSIPLNPYASAGIAYIPIYFSTTERFKWNQVGFNLNLGVDYEISKGIGIGVDYRYFKSFTDLEASQSSYFFSVPSQEGVKFSNLNLSLVFYP